ncbi:site-specific integrase [Candidatus Bathyarchaeota archaeon]|nr:site-specific integrase [Candidatus Bathyarchaeota archaeon]
MSHLRSLEMGRIGVNEFIRQFPSKSTKNNYRVSLIQFFCTIYPELKPLHPTSRYGSQDLWLKFYALIDEKSIQYLDEGRNFRNDYMTFKESLEGKPPKTIMNRMNPVNRFLQDNDIILPKRFVSNVNGKESEAISEEKIPSNDELRRILEYLPVQGKALALMLSSSGLRLGEAVSLEISDIDWGTNPVQIKIRQENSKTGKSRITFMSQEARLAVEEWLKFREQYVIQAEARTVLSKRHGRSNDLLFPFSQENFNSMWLNALSKTQLGKRDKRTNRTTLHPHNLRKFFRMVVGRYGIDEVECMLGHQTGLNKVYANLPDKTDGIKRIAEVYLKAEKDLSVYKRGADLEKFRVDLEKKFESQSSALDYLQSENLTLKNKLKEIEAERTETHRLIEEGDQTITRISDLLTEMGNRITNIEKARGETR